MVMPDPSKSEGSPSVGAKVSPEIKQRVQEIAHERTVPGKTKVRESDVLRDALRIYTDIYDTESGPEADPEVRGKIDGGRV